MLGRTQKKAEHGREREVGGWEKAKKKSRIGEITYMDGMRQDFLTNFCMIDIVRHCSHASI